MRSRKAAQWRKLRMQALVAVLVGVMVAGLAAWLNESWLKERVYWLIHARGHALTAEVERALTPGDLFKECTDCPAARR